jgi:Zinc knuckle
MNPEGRQLMDETEDFCRHCREYGHLAHDCPADPPEAYR